MVEILLGDKEPMVLSSAIFAFNEVDMLFSESHLNLNAHQNRLPRLTCTAHKRYAHLISRKHSCEHETLMLLAIR